MPDLIISWGGVTTVRIARPQFANSVTPELMDNLRAVFEEVERRDDVRAVVLTGTGSFFCAGADVRAQHDLYVERGLDAAMDYQYDTWMPSVQRAIRAVWNASKPVVAAINGAATAGGLDLALCCDYRIAVPNAKLGESYISLGLVTVAGGSYLLPLHVGRGKGTWMLLSGQLISGEEGAGLGLIDELAKPEEIMERAVQRATEMSASAPEAIRRMKQVIRASLQAGLDASMSAGLENNGQLLHTKEVQERFLKILNSFRPKSDQKKA
jgi:2-(1,2-epoxy-1,2-dihydrophenyl)acetyl-CoA isomerase